MKPGLSRVVVSHPGERKKSPRWGTELLFLSPGWKEIVYRKDEYDFRGGMEEYAYFNLPSSVGIRFPRSHRYSRQEKTREPYVTPLCVIGPASARAPRPTSAAGETRSYPREPCSMLRDDDPG